MNLKSTIKFIITNKMYCIEGNIGAGKSTLIKCLSEKYICYQEPVSEWTLLDFFYKDMKKYAFPFQYQVLLSQFNQIKEINKLDKNQLVFMERCPWTSRNVFFEMMIEDNILSSKELEIFDNFYNIIPQNITKMFYLILDTEICKQRIIERNRYEELNITYEYLKRLEDKYLSSLKKSNFEVVYINAKNKTPEDLSKIIMDNIIFDK